MIVSAVGEAAIDACLGSVVAAIWVAARRRCAGMVSAVGGELFSSFRWGGDSGLTARLWRGQRRGDRLGGGGGSNRCVPRVCKGGHLGYRAAAVAGMVSVVGGELISSFGGAAIRV